MSENGAYGSRIKTYLFLHFLLVIYAAASVCSKYAARQEIGTAGFFLFYGLDLLLLFGYALGWQQILKRIPLTSAFAHRSVTVVWGAVFGLLLFRETLSLKQLAGILLVICGTLLFSFSEKEDPHGSR